MKISPAGNRRLAQWRVTWLNEHSVSHQLLWCIDTFVLRNPPLRQAPTRCAAFPMTLQSASILLMLTVLLSCKTSQNHSFIKSKSEKQVHLVGVNRPYVDFVLESGDTLKFSNHDVLLLLEKQSRNQIKSQGYSSNKSLRDISETLSGKNTDTIVYQNLSAVGNKTLSGILDTWIARELLLEGRAIVAQNNQADNPKRLRYVFIKDNLGGQQGTFYAESGKKIYWTIIALGE